MAESTAPARVLARLAFGGAVLVGLGVLLDVTGPLDHAARDLFWPGQHWGTVQRRADTTANLLGPPVLVQASLAGALVVSFARRRATPLLFVLATSLVAAAVVLGTKWAFDQLEAFSVADRDLGAFPSGHMVAAIVFSGQLVLLLPPSRTSLLAWMPTIALGGAMAAAVQIAALHHVTDVLGGALVGVGLLASASVSRLRHSAVSQDHPAVPPRNATRRGATRSAS